MAIESNTSKETVGRLLRQAFDKCTNFWQTDEAKEYIQAARDAGLIELANTMQNDLRL